MRRILVVAVVAATAIASCSGGGDQETTTTTTRPAATTTTVDTTSTTRSVPDCALEFSIPVEGDVTDECRLFYLEEVASQDDVDLTAAAETQAVALCREIRISGLIEGVASAFLAWNEGSRPSPSTQEETFVALAVGIYCPEYFDELHASNN